MTARHQGPPEKIHRHARLVARRWQLPVERLAYLDDPDQIDEYAEILVRRRERSRRRREQAYWSALYGGTVALFLLGVLLSTALIVAAFVWILLIGSLGLVVLTPTRR